MPCRGPAAAAGTSVPAADREQRQAGQVWEWEWAADSKSRMYGERGV